MDLATGNATTVVIPQAMVQHMLVHHCRTQASRIREMQYRKVSIDRLELTSGPMGTPFTMS